MRWIGSLVLAFVAGLPAVAASQPGVATGLHAYRSFSEIGQGVGSWSVMTAVAVGVGW